MASKRKFSKVAYEPRKKSKTSYKRRPSRPTTWAKRINGRLTLGSPVEETKYYDETGNNVTFTTGSASIVYPLLDNIAQGSSSTGTRIGNKILVKSLATKINWASNSSSGTQIFPQVHIAVVLDKQANNAAAAVTDVYTSIAGNDNLVMRNNDNLDRFQILKEYNLKPTDWFMGENPSGLIGYANSFWECYLPLDIAVRFKDATGNPITNNLLMVINTNATTNQVITISAQYNRVRYADA